MKEGFHPPTRTGTIGMNLFLAALFMLFSAGLFGYILIRTKQEPVFPFGSLHVPPALWVSTALVILASFTVQKAVTELRHEHQPPFRRWLMITTILAALFCVVQAPSMVLLLQQQQIMLRKKIAVYGLVFALIMLHALHVLGGIVAMSWTFKRARENAYDHENFQPVARLAHYWHFLDLVWIAMFVTFEAMK